MKRRHHTLLKASQATCRVAIAHMDLRRPRTPRPCGPPRPSLAIRRRQFGRLKRWQAVATGCDKHARNYRSGIVLAAIVTFWL